MPKQPLLLNHRRALGDTVCFTALARDIERAYPGRYDVLIQSHFNELWNHNPYARMISARDGGRKGLISARLSYQNGIRRAGRGESIHMLRGFHASLKEQTGIDVPLSEPRGDLHMTDAELKPLVEGDYWLVIAGGKIDATVKVWRPHLWQKVVDALRDHGIFCVQGGALFQGNFHPELERVTTVVNRYRSPRQFANLVANAKGVICPVTAAMHLAACFDKPCVVIAGGREEPWWEAYTSEFEAFGPKCRPVKVEHRFLHTIGELACCQTKGCWKHRVVPLNRDDGFDAAYRLCKMPVASRETLGPKCLDLITPEQVVDAVLSYSTEKHGDEPHEVIASDNIIPAVKPANTVDTLIHPQPFTVVDANRVKPVTVQGHKPPAPPNDGPNRHPTLGDRLTAFVLCYGPHTDMAKRCIDSILESKSSDRLDLRVACNESAPATIDYLQTLALSRLYINPVNRKKYPVMREILRDPTCPITTPYFVWFDDDTKVINAKWIDRLGEVIEANHPGGFRLYGWKMYHNLQGFSREGYNPVKWFQRAKWFKNRHLRVRGSFKEAPNGTMVEFVAGWFWAMATEMINKADIPDRRLNHNGGDITIGEQVHQAGYRIKMFNKDKSLVWCPKKEQGGRRGYSEPFPWAG